MSVKAEADIPEPLVDLAEATRTAKAALHARRAEPGVKAGQKAVIEKHASRKTMGANSRNARKKSADTTPPSTQLGFDFRTMRTTLFGFRNDLRLHDQRALKQAIEHAEQHAQRLLLVYVHEPVQDAPTAWGFRRMGAHRRRFLADTLQDLQASLQALGQRLVLLQGPVADVHSNFPYPQTQCRGGETSALAHLKSYLTPPWPDRYKQTRNALQGQHTSSHWSPWLATGAVSARRIWADLHAYEQQYGANDGTYWLWFELLWRDNFRLLHLQHGPQLYATRGLSDLPRPSHYPKDFQRWCSGQTGEPIVDAGMRELAATGFTSNRMRQIVASFLVHDLACDWRAGAAWFESQLVDFDVCSNQGNWLYVSGRGTDPRVGRRFNPTKQTQDHDPQGRYRKAWLPS